MRNFPLRCLVHTENISFKVTYQWLRDGACIRTGIEQESEIGSSKAALALAFRCWATPPPSPFKHFSGQCNTGGSPGGTHTEDTNQILPINYQQHFLFYLCDIITIFLTFSDELLGDIKNGAVTFAHV